LQAFAIVFFVRPFALNAKFPTAVRRAIRDLPALPLPSGPMIFNKTVYVRFVQVLENGHKKNQGKKTPKNQ
jgi:hypothetical protein